MACQTVSTGSFSHKISHFVEFLGFPCAHSLERNELFQYNFFRAARAFHPVGPDYQFFSIEHLIFKIVKSSVLRFSNVFHQKSNLISRLNI